MKRERRIWKENLKDVEGDSSDLRTHFWIGIYISRYLSTPLTIKGTLDETMRFKYLWVYMIFIYVQINNVS